MNNIPGVRWVQVMISVISGSFFAQLPLSFHWRMSTASFPTPFLLGVSWMASKTKTTRILCLPLFSLRSRLCSRSFLSCCCVLFGNGGSFALFPRGPWVLDGVRTLITARSVKGWRWPRIIRARGGGVGEGALLVDIFAWTSHYLDIYAISRAALLL